MRRAHRRPLGDVLEAHGVRGRAEVKGAAVEDPVDRSDDRAAVCGGGRQSEQPHAVEALGNLRRRQPMFGAVDAQRVPAGLLVAAVQDLLQRR
jgi:hypothetical protein